MFFRKPKSEGVELEILKFLAERARELMESSDVKLIDTALTDLRSAWVNAPEGEDKEAAWDALHALSEHAEQIADGVLASTLRPCTSCEGRTFQVSDELSIDEVTYGASSGATPQFRLVVCMGCGKTEWFASDVSAVVAHSRFDKEFTVKKRRDDGPYR